MMTYNSTKSNGANPSLVTFVRVASKIEKNQLDSFLRTYPPKELVAIRNGLDLIKKKTMPELLEEIQHAKSLLPHVEKAIMQFNTKPSDRFMMD